MNRDMIAVLDLGGKNNTDIVRKIRELGVYSEIHPHDVSLVALKQFGCLRGIIINGCAGGDDSDTLDCTNEIYECGIPLLVANHKTPAHPIDINEWPNSDANVQDILGSFLFKICKAEKNWTMNNFIDAQVELIRKQVGDKKVLLALSGGVDSSVVAALLIKAIGNQLFCVHVNHGLLRKGESDDVLNVFKNQYSSNFIYVDASERFLNKLSGVSDPERKRKVIGEEFIRVFEEEAKKLSGISFLAQGTIYPDIIESGTKTAKTIKSHHNVGGLPENLNFELVEPLAQLYKDEVRQCGILLGLPHDMVYRQPFPGPGLAVRCTGAIEVNRLEAVRESDAILREEFKNSGLENEVWQFFTIVPEFRSTGIRNNNRTYEYTVIIRAVNTLDAMTASVPRLPWDILERITSRILSEVADVNRVCYDLSPKPFATIEWE